MTTKKLEWKFTQVFGDKVTAEKVAEEDIINAMNFDTTGKYLALGDKAGRLIVFQRNISKKSKKNFSEFSYVTEIQSHYRDFDLLKSVYIDEKINCIECLSPQNDSMFLLSTNDKTIKLWKVCNKSVKKSEKFPNKKYINPSNLALPKLKLIDQGLCPSLKRVYPNLHQYHVNSLSVLQDGQNFLSSDDLAVYLWDLESTQKAYMLIDIKPEKIDELNEVITACKASPISDFNFVYGTSKASIRLVDMREGSSCTGKGIRFEDNSGKQQKNFFTDIISSISDVKFTNSGRYLVSRDFLSVKTWDPKMPKSPLLTTVLYEPLKTKLCDLYENDCIFDKFDLNLSPDSSHCVTGIFDNKFHITNIASHSNTQFELNFKKKTLFRNIGKSFYEQIPSNFDVNKKVLKTAWNPTSNCIVIASLNCLFFYNGF
jgi:serine/threonine-protein phosphatase 2A regulatory subunit B